MNSKTVTLSFLFALAGQLTACSVEPPNEREIIEKVYAYYYQQNENMNSSSYDVQNVAILSINEDSSRENTFNVTFIANGSLRTTDASGNIEASLFADTLNMALEWNGAKWITLPR